MTEVPLAPGQVYGFRFWYAGTDGYLRSVTHSEMGAWQPGENVAGCAYNRPPEPPPRPTYTTSKTAMWKPAHRAQLSSFEVGSRRFRDTRRGDIVGNDIVVTPEQIEATYRRMSAEYDEAVIEYERALAEYDPNAHVAPVQGCECGFYLVKDPSVASAYANHHPSVYFGVVKGYGRTVPMHKGWKVQRARIVSLSPWTGESDYLTQMYYYMSRALEYEAIHGRRPDPEEIQPPRVTIGTARVSVTEGVRQCYPEVEFFDNAEKLTTTWEERVAT